MRGIQINCAEHEDEYAPPPPLPKLSSFYVAVLFTVTVIFGLIAVSNWTKIANIWFAVVCKNFAHHSIPVALFEI